jgi:hypothetical protein
MFGSVFHMTKLIRDLKYTVYKEQMTIKNTRMESQCLPYFQDTEAFYELILESHQNGCGESGA